MPAGSTRWNCEMRVTLVAVATDLRGQPLPEHLTVIFAPFGALTDRTWMFAPLVVNRPRMRTTGSGLNIFAFLVSAAPSTPPDGAVGSGCAVGATSGVGCTPRSNVGVGAGVGALTGVLTGVAVGVGVLTGVGVGVGVLTGVGVGVGVFTGVGVGVATGTVVTLAVGFDARQRMSF